MVKWAVNLTEKWTCRLRFRADVKLTFTNDFEHLFVCKTKLIPVKENMQVYTFTDYRIQRNESDEAQ